MIGPGKTLGRLTQARGSRSIAGMTDAPRITGAKRAATAAREARLSHALRANLQRRKEQARAREKRAADRSIDNAATDEPPA